jgi:hypothetical protein
VLNVGRYFAIETIVVMLTQSLQPMPYRAFCPIRRTINRYIEVGFGVLDHHILCATKGNLNPTSLIVASARPIDIKQANSDRADVLAGPTKGELQAPFGMLAQSFRQIEPSCLNVHAHEVPPVGLNTEGMLGGTDTSYKSIIR